MKKMKNKKRVILVISFLILLAIYAVVNLSDLLAFEENSVIDLAALTSKGLVKKVYDGVKVLGNLKDGETFNKKYTVKANKFSKSAEAAITAAGGPVEVI